MTELRDIAKELKCNEDAHVQYGALCYRVLKGKTQVLLITSRTRRRWIIPKGWPVAGTTPEKSAAIEAWEEAGVRGKLSSKCIGTYDYIKEGEGSEADRHCIVGVFPLKVKTLAEAFPERKQRRRKWFSPKSAAKKVAEPELRELLRVFEPGL